MSATQKAPSTLHRWDSARYHQVLVMLKRTGLFRNLDTAHGYDARRELTRARKSTIRKLYNEVRYTHDEKISTSYQIKRIRRGGFTVDENVRVFTHTLIPFKNITYYTPRSQKNNRTARSILVLQSAFWKTLPFPVLPGAKNVSVSVDNKKKRATLIYKDWHLEQVICRFNEKRILESVMFANEETETTDGLVDAYIDEARATMGDLEANDDYTFRFNTIYGLMSSADFHRTTGVLSDLVERQLKAVFNKYNVTAELEDGRIVYNNMPVITGISATRKLKGFNNYNDLPKDWSRVNMNRPKPSRRKKKKSRARK